MNPPLSLNLAVVAGAAKAGTTSLHRALLQHPEICFHKLKEPDFFSKNENYAQGISAYKRDFSQEEQHKVAFDGSTTYARLPAYPDAPERIASHFADARLVYLMREPVARTWSHYLHRKRWSGDSASFKDMCERDSSIMKTSDYASHIALMHEYFPKDQLHCCFYEELIQNPAQEIKKILSHIGVDSESGDWSTLPTSNAGADNDLRSKTTLKLRKLPGMGLLADALPQRVRDTAFQAVKKLSRKQDNQDNKIPPELFRDLSRRFATASEELTQTLGRSLPAAWDYSAVGDTESL